MAEVLRQLDTAVRLRGREPGTAGSYSLSFRGNELAGEVGEACNILKKLDRERMGLAGKRASVEDLKEELADIIICVALVAADLDIDIVPEIPKKFNKTSRERGALTTMPEGK